MRPNSVFVDTTQRIVLSLAAFLVVGSALLMGIKPAAAVDGLAVASSTTFRVDPDNALIDVEVVFTVTNVTPNRTRNGVTTQYYYHGLSVPIPVEATQISATRSDGRSLETERPGAEPEYSFQLLEVRLGRNLFYRSSSTFTLRYILPSGDARDFTSGVRVNPAYAVFDAYGIGDADAVNVRVEVPKAFDVTITGSAYRVRLEDDINVYEATDIPNPDEFYLLIVARNDAALSTRNIKLGDDAQIAIRAWPGDEAWADFVAEELESGFVELQALVNLPFPDDELEIVESIDPGLQGYAGWYIKSEQLIEVSEEFDSETLLHELAHAWFNRALFSERWIGEGLAEEFASRSLEATGEELSKPKGPRTTSRYQTDLNLWTPPYVIDDNTRGTDEYGYNASWFVMRSLSEEIGIDGLAAIVAAAGSDAIAYRGEGPPESVEWSTDNWRRFLDLAQETEGSTTVEDLFTEYVVSPPQEGIVQQRALARTEYGILKERGGSWAPPVGIRRHMSDWEFSSADEAIQEAVAVLDDRDELRVVAADANLEIHDGPELQYQDAVDLEDLQEVRSQVVAYTASAATIAQADAAVTVDYGVVASVGLWGTDFERPYGEARELFERGDVEDAASLADEAIAGYATAGDRGLTRLIVSALVLLGAAVGLLAIRWWRQREKGGPAANSTVEPEPDAEQQSPDLWTIDDRGPRVRA